MSQQTLKEPTRYDSRDKYYAKVRRLSERKVLGLTSWWRRRTFYKGPDDAKPRWHVFTERVSLDPENRWKVTYRALCGYTFTFDEVIFNIPLFRDDVKTPSLQCSRCAKLLAQKHSEDS